MTGKQQVVKAAKDYGPWVLLAALTFGVTVQWPGDRLTALEKRTTALEGTVRDVAELLDTWALSECLKETHPTVRFRLRCGAREAEAGIRR